MKIKIYGDGANIEDMKRVYKEGIVKGFTTNPTLMKKAGITKYEEFAKNVLKEISDVPISFEVFSDELEEMEREARTISSWGKNVNIKIPITNTKGISTIPIIKKLSDEGLKLNVTAVFTIEQMVDVFSAMNPAIEGIISVFAGRIADTGQDPTPYIMFAVEQFKNTNIDVLWASTREVYNIVQADKLNVDIITVPYDILKKMSMFGIDLKELSLDTVKMFYNDAKSSGFKI